MTEIRHLPDHLRIVPPAPLSPDDPDANEKREAFLAWRTDVYRFRVERQSEMLRYPELQAVERFKCADDPAYWLAIYGTILEPRPDRSAAGGGHLPYIPFGKQVDLLRWVDDILQSRGAEGDGVVSKSRDVGATWMFCSYALHGWLFKSPWNVLLISRKEDLVDSKKQESMFAKIDMLYLYLPEWMKPAKYDPNKHRQKLYMFNPENDNELGGESTTTKTGRGTRATWAMIDEAAQVPDLLDTWNNIAPTASHRIASSSEHLEQGPDFYNLRTGTDMEYRPSLFEIDWWDNPLNDDAWFENEKIRMASKPGAFEREVLRNPHGDGSTIVYPRSWDPELEPNPAISILPMAETFITCDPGQLDETALVVLQIDPATDNVNVLDAYQNSKVDAPFYASLLAADPDEERYPNMYGEREWEFMDLIRNIPGPTYVGDTYGDTSNGATMDTFYTVISRYTNPQGSRIVFNRDRLGNKDKGMYTKSLTTFRGRRESLMEYIPRFRFSDASGAVFAHRALKSNRYKPQIDRGAMSEPKTPLHDWTSHIVQALEFWAVFRRSRRASLTHKWAKPQKATLYASKTPHHVARSTKGPARRYARTG